MCIRGKFASAIARPDYREMKKAFHRGVLTLLGFFYRLSGEIKIHGKQFLEEAMKRGRVVIATTHANIERSIPIGLAIKEQFYLIVIKKMKPRFLRKWYLDPFIRLLNGIWIEGSESPYPRKDVEAMARVIDTYPAHTNHEPKYVLIAVSGDYNSDNPEEYVAKRGLALAHEIRRKWNQESGITRFDSFTVPSAEFERVDRARSRWRLLGPRKDYVIVYGQPIDPNDFVVDGRVDCDGLTMRIQNNIRGIMARAQQGEF